MTTTRRRALAGRAVLLVLVILAVRAFFQFSKSVKANNSNSNSNKELVKATIDTASDKVTAWEFGSSSLVDKQLLAATNASTAAPKPKTALKTSKIHLPQPATAEPVNTTLVPVPVPASEIDTSPQPANTTTTTKCAMLFFGLPRSFELVLPSIQTNIFQPNAAHRCDVYVHSYNITHESTGLLNAGGRIDPNAILKLKDAVHQVYRSSSAARTDNEDDLPHVSIAQEKPNTTHLEAKYRDTKNEEDGTFVYYPYKVWNWPDSIGNLVQQWHSIEQVWYLMEQQQLILKRNYTRIAAFRSDVIYVLPIDIYDQGGVNKGTIVTADVFRKASVPDTKNTVITFPYFALNPNNDRMIYGPYEAIRIWATQRFTLLEKHKDVKIMKGLVLHPETFLQRAILPAMLRYYRDTHTNNMTRSNLSTSKANSFTAQYNPRICFLRVRANGQVRVNDCNYDKHSYFNSMATQEKIRQIEQAANATCSALPNKTSKGEMQITRCQSNNKKPRPTIRSGKALNNNNNNIPSTTTTTDTAKHPQNGTDRTLVIYAGPTSLDKQQGNNNNNNLNRLFLANFEYFLRHGVDCTNDILVVVTADVLTHYQAQVTQLDQDCAARTGRHIYLLAREDRCFDMEAVRLGLMETDIVFPLSAVDASTEGTVYDYLCVVSCGMFGPYPHRRWTSVFTSKLNDQVKLSGLSHNCKGPGGDDVGTPHIQSSMYCLDAKKGLQTVLDAGAVFDCRLNYTVSPAVPKTKVNPRADTLEIIRRYEMGVSKAILDAGYGIASHVRPKVLFSNASLDCQDDDIWHRPRFNAIFRDHFPTLQETIFFKSTRFLTEEIRAELNFSLAQE